MARAPYWLNPIPWPHPLPVKVRSPPVAPAGEEKLSATTAVSTASFGKILNIREWYVGEKTLEAIEVSEPLGFDPASGHHVENEAEDSQ